MFENPKTGLSLRLSCLGSGVLSLTGKGIEELAKKLYILFFGRNVMMGVAEEYIEIDNSFPFYLSQIFESKPSETVKLSVFRQT
jgi:hypothetical protein